MKFAIKIMTLGLILVMFLCLISSVSALTTKDFKLNRERTTHYTNYGKIFLSEKWWLDLFGWNKKPIQDIDLIENTEICGREKCHAIMNVSMHKKGKLVDSERFENIKEDGSRSVGHPINYGYFIRGEQFSYEVDDYENQCVEEINTNGSVSQVCNKEFIGSHTEYEYEWLPYNYEEVKKGNYILKLNATIPLNKRYDWLITAQGKEIEEWAYWTTQSDFNITYDQTGTSGGGSTGEGLNFTTNEFEVNLTYVRSYDDGNTGTCMLVYGDRTHIKNVSMSGGLCFFGVTLSSNTDYTIQLTQSSNPDWGNSDGNVFLNTTGINITGTCENLGIGNPCGNSNPARAWGIEELNYTINSGQVELDSPIDDFVTSTLTQNLSASILHTQNLTNASLYINGVKNDTQFLTGTENVTSFTKTFALGNYNWTIQACDIDGDCGWASENRSLTIDNVAPTVSVSYGNGTFNYGSLTTNHTINYTATDSIAGLSRCWLDYNAVNTTIPCTSGSVNTTNFELEQGVYSAIVWANDTANNIGSYPFNWSYAFFGGTAVYESNVSETNSSKFSFQIDSDSDILFQYGILNYNGTNHLAESECISNTCYFNVTIDIPLVTGGLESQLKNFNWNLTLFDGDSSYNLGTDYSEQNVSKVYLIKCGGAYTTQTMNFSLQEESNLSSLGAFSFDGSFDYWLGGGSVKQNYSYGNSTDSVYNLCISPNTTYYIDAIIDYSKDNITYIDRNYYMLNHSISGISQNIIFYLLQATQSTSFIQVVENQQSQAISNALIYTYRFYPELNDYKVVQITKTNEQGKSIGFYKAETVDYKHIITKDGDSLLETVLGKIFPESAPYTLTFRTGEAAEIPYTDLQDDPTVTSTLTFNSTTNVTRFTWISLDSQVKWGRLLVYQQKQSTENLLICNETLAFPSGILTCDVSGYEGTFVAYAYISKSPEAFIKSINFVISTGRAVFGNLGVLLGWFIILTVCLIFIWNPTAMIVAANVGIIFVSMIGLIEFPMIFIFGIIAVSVIAIIFLKT